MPRRGFQGLMLTALACGALQRQDRVGIGREAALVRAQRGGVETGTFVEHGQQDQLDARLLRRIGECPGQRAGVGIGRAVGQDAVNMIVNGYCKEVFKQLPMEFAVEAQKLLGVSLEGSVG